MGIVAIMLWLELFTIATAVDVRANTIFSVLLKAKSIILLIKLMFDLAYVEVFITDKAEEFSEITYTADLLLFVIRFIGLDIPIIVFNSFWVIVCIILILFDP